MQLLAHCNWHGKPPSDWEKFTELTFRISNVPSKAAVIELRDAFGAYGYVYKVRIKTKDCANGVERSTKTYLSLIGSYKNFYIFDILLFNRPC